jgi:hypothetical protein
LSGENEVPDTRNNGNPTALILLGCPQVPVQTGSALYLINKLRKLGVTPVVAGNRAARTNIEVSDPDRHYIGEVIDIDRCIAELAEKKRDFRYCFAFIHNDAGVTYAATIQALSSAAMVVIIFGEHYTEISGVIGFPAEKLAINAVHNPMPIKAKLDDVLPSLIRNL